jgi:hypothetical protein
VRHIITFHHDQPLIYMVVGAIFGNLYRILLFFVFSSLSYAIRFSHLWKLKDKAYLLHCIT